MVITSTLSSNNQTTIPKAVVDALKLEPSAILCYEVEPDGRVVLTAKSATFAELADTFPRKDSSRKASVEEMNEAVKAGAARRYKKSAQ